MYIIQFSRWKGGKPEDMIKAAKQAKALFEKHGAEWFRLSRFHTGAWAGEWLVAVRYPSWSAYGKGQDEMAKDAEYQKLLAQVMSMAELTARNITVGVDL
jgi:hypothetical protein